MPRENLNSFTQVSNTSILPGLGFIAKFFGDIRSKQEPAQHEPVLTVQSAHKEIEDTMKVFRMTSMRTWGTIAVVLATLSLAFPAQAKKSDSRNHPLRVLKSRYQNDQSRGESGSARGNLTVWLQNAVGVPVDGIELEVELYNDRRRKVETLKKTVGSMAAGKKKVLTFRWDIVAEDVVKPKIFILYNARGNQKARFEDNSGNGN